MRGGSPRRVRAADRRLRLGRLAQPGRPFGRALVGGSVAITYGLMELARAIGARVILPSSIAVFAGAPDGACLKRHDRPLLADDFGVARWMSETVAAECAARHGSALLIVRLSHVYGGDNIRPSVLVNAAERLAVGQSVTLHRFANGLPALDLLHIDDAARALVAAARSTETGVVHVGSGRVEAVADVVALMAKDLATPPQLRFEDKLGARRAIRLDELWHDPAIMTGRTPLAVGARSMLQDRMTALRR
jgi:nucleoside-diphosphate-sugar epimerase